MIFSSPPSLTDALKNALAKRVLALSPDIGTQEIQNNIPAAIRQRAFFSARPPYADYLQETSTEIQRLLQPDVIVNPDGTTRAPAKGESISPAEVRARMKERLAALDYRPAEGEAGTIKDLSSDRRTNLIISTQLGMSRGYGNWRQSQAPAVLDLFPADELFRALDKEKPRDWVNRWNDARATLGDSTTATAADIFDVGPFIALKNDPIWTEISAFGNPYPPFDFQSGMRVRDVSRPDAIAAGVLAPDETVEPAQASFEDPSLEDIPESIPEPFASILRQAFASFISTGLKKLLGRAPASASEASRTL